MKLRYIVPLSLFFVCLLNGLSYPEISQYFDSEGNPLSAKNRSRADRSAAGTQRYSVPEGVVLQNDIRYEFYPVFGKTFSEIVQSAEENIPINRKDRKRMRPARFDWTVGWTYDIDYSEEMDEEEQTVRVSVEIYDININYDIKITLPTLIDDTVLNPAEKTLWKNYYLRLVKYEHSRANMIRDKNTQDELRKKFIALDNAVFFFPTDIDIKKTVEALIQKETQKIGSEWVRNLKKKISEYDKETE
jgi:predicted secreted Zn-dependent protease